MIEQINAQKELCWGARRIERRSPVTGLAHRELMNDVAGGHVSLTGEPVVALVGPHEKSEIAQ